MKRSALLVLLLLSTVCVACSAPGDTPRTVADYTPVADQTLFATIENLPDVEAANLSFNDTWPEYIYIAEVRASSEVDVDVLAEQIISTLRKGRFRADVTLAIAQDGRQVYSESFRWPVLDKRYGPQPSRPAGD